MASTVSELLVRIKPEGTEQTANDLEDMSETFEDTAEGAGEQLGMLEEFSQKWQGAMQIVVAGLAVASAGLLANVPVLGEAFAGLRAIMNAIAFQMDEVLRPIFGPLSNAMFSLSNAIFQLEGAWGTLVGIAGTVVSVLSVVAAAIASVGFASGGLSGAIAALSSAFSVVVSAISAVVGAAAALVAGISAAAAAVIVAVLAIVAFLAAYITNFMGVRDKTNKFVSDIIKFVVKLATQVIKWVKRTWEGVTKWFDKMLKDVSKTFATLVQRAFQAGRNLVNELIRGLQSRLSSLRRMANRVANAVRDRLPGSPAKTGPLSDLDRVGPGLVDTVARGMEQSTPRMERASGRVATAADPRGQGTRATATGETDGAVISQLENLARAMTNNTVEVPVNLDSREVARGVAPLIARGAVNSGATQVRR